MQKLENLLGLQLCCHRFFQNLRLDFQKVITYLWFKVLYGETSGEYGGWSKTSHFIVSIYVLAGLATCGRALSCWRITLSCISWYCGCFSFNARLKRIKCVEYRSPVMVSLRFQQLIKHHTVLVMIFLTSESFLWLWGVSKWLVESLPMILPIILAFGTSLQQVMHPIRNLPKFSFFHSHVGPRHQIYRS